MPKGLSGLALASLLGLSCSSDSTHPPPGVIDGDADSDTDTDTDADGDADCVDYDDDLHGINCDAGPDCDDADPTVFDDCSTCTTGAVRESCPCVGTEDPSECHSDQLFEDEHGRLRCKIGERACQDPEGDGSYVWSECILSDQFL
jgi:hypothetical protein